jgi:polysaccharide biosynthesis transport protein
MNLTQAIAIFWSRRGIIIAVFVGTVLSALAALSLIQPQYAARAQIFVNIADANAATNNQVSSSGARTYVNSLVEALRSRGTAVAVVVAKDLANDARRVARFRGTNGPNADVVDWIAAGLQRNLQVARQGLSDIISITYQSPDALEAADMANAFTDVAIRRDAELRAAPALESVRLHEERLKSLRERFSEVEAQRSRLRLEAIRRGDVDAAGTTDPNASVASMLANARSAVVQARAALDLAQSGQNPPAESSELLSLRRSLSDMELALQRETPLLGPEHRRIQTLRKNAAELRAQITSATSRLRNDLIADRGRELAAAERRVGDIAQILSQDETQRDGQSQSRALANSLERELEGLKGQIEALVQRRERASSEGAASLSNMSVLSRAATPASPIWPRADMVMLVAVAVGLALGFALAFLREMLDRRVRCVDDLKAYFDVPVLGEVAPTRLSKGMAAMPVVPTFGLRSPSRATYALADRRAPIEG